MPLLSCLSRTWSHIQGNLFPWLSEELGPLTETHKQVVTALEVAGVDPRNRHHQRYCSVPACRAASKATSQARWLAAAENQRLLPRPGERRPGPGVAVVPSRLLAQASTCRHCVTRCLNGATHLSRC
jgi:hypothetical protein